MYKKVYTTPVAETIAMNTTAILAGSVEPTSVDMASSDWSDYTEKDLPETKIETNSDGSQTISFWGE